MSDWISLSQGRHYPSSQISALVRLLRAEGIGAEAALAGTGLAADELDDVACLTSLEQYMLVCRNAVQLSSSASLALRLGRALHLPDHGMVGLMLLSCESVPEYFRLAAKYQSMIISPLDIEAQITDDGALWVVSDEPALELLPQAVRVFLIEQQFGQLVTQIQDLLGSDCGPTQACFAHSAPAHQTACTSYLQCPSVFGRRRNELRFDKGILTRRPRLANSFTSATLQSACEGLLADRESSSGFAGKVYQALRFLSGPGAGMQAVASTLKMTDRTLRRHLADEGTSFSTIVDQVRCSLATQQLQRPELSVEEVAEMTGFSDPANFRRAFTRWTGMTPTCFRQLHQKQRGPSLARAQAGLSPGLTLPRFSGLPRSTGQPWP